MAGPLGRAVARSARGPFGPYQTAKRCYPLSWAGCVRPMFEAVSADIDFEWLSINATVIHAQAQAAGARVKRGGSAAHALGCSRGGFVTRSMP